MILKPFRKHFLIGGWTEPIAIMYLDLVGVDDIRKWEATLEAPAQLVLQLFIISRGRAAGKCERHIILIN